MYSRNFLVDTSTTDPTQELNDSDLCTQPAPHAAQLETDDTTPNDDHLFRNLLQRQCTRRAHNLFLVDLDRAARERRDFGAGGNDDVLAFYGLGAAVEEVDGERVTGGEGRSALDVVDFILFEEKFDTLGKASDGIIFCFKHSGQVKLDVADCIIGRKTILSDNEEMLERFGQETDHQYRVFLCRGEFGGKYGSC